MILIADSECPDQTARMRMSAYTQRHVFAWRGPNGTWWNSFTSAFLQLWNVYSLQNKCEHVMEFFAMLLSLFISGTYGQWSEVSLSTTCEDLIQPFPCPGEPKVCEHCAACVSQYFNKCKCLPASLLAESQDGATICLWVTWKFIILFLP